MRWRTCPRIPLEKPPHIVHRDALETGRPGGEPEESRRAVLSPYLFDACGLSGPRSCCAR